MDFDLAERKLKSDQDRLKSQVRNRNAARLLTSINDSSKAKKLELHRRKELDFKKQERELFRKKISYANRGYDAMERKLGVERHLRNVDSALFLEAVSVHGQGDKITLPPSVLANLADRDLMSINQQTGQPLFFRLGIKREGYKFPQSETMNKIMQRYQQKTGVASESIESSSEDEDIVQEKEWEQAYTDELRQEYVAYTYATVIEFSQEEGSVGLPANTANALLKSTGDEAIPSKFTNDPALSKMEIENELEEDFELKTPGHPAYCLFPVPASQIEIVLVKKLPLGARCTLQPSEKSIQNGFYGLVDVKHVLEQSLIRTRGCLNIGDLMHCWFRGKKFDLTVQDVLPRSVGAISCVNCDIEVDIAPFANSQMEGIKDQTINTADHESKMDGYRLGDFAHSSTIDYAQSIANVTALPIEPPIDRAEGVITIHIKGEGKTSKRRFYTKDLFDSIFDFAIAEGLSSSNARFRFVTRFPRRVFERHSDMQNIISDMNLSSNELLLVEKY